VASLLIALGVLSARTLLADESRLADFARIDDWSIEAPTGTKCLPEGGLVALVAKPEADRKPASAEDRDRGIFNPAGNNPDPGRNVVLRLKRRPLLPADAVRAGLWIFVDRPIKTDGLWLILVDAKGRDFEYALPAPESFQSGWQYLDTFPFDANERGKLHPNVGRQLGGGEGLPVKPLKLSGLRVEVRSDAGGKWLLGDLETDGHLLGDHQYHWGLNIPGSNPRLTQTLLRSGEEPFLPAGKILPAGGKADVSWEVRSGFQGEVVAHGGTSLDIRAGDAVALARRLPLGDLPEGDYDIVVTVRQAGKDLQQQRLSLIVLDSPVKAAPPAAIRLSAEPGEPLKIPLASWHEQPGGKTWRIENATGKVVASGDLEDDPVAWRPPSPGVFRYVAERVVDGQVVDRDVRLVGGRVPRDQLGPADFSTRGNVPSEQDLFGPGHNYFTWAMYENHPEDPRYWDWCRQWIAAGRAAGFDLFRLRLDWGKIEMLPGVFDFSMTDRLVAEVARQGGQAILELRFEAPDWLPVSHQLDSYGRADVWNHGRLGRIPSVWTPGMLDSIRQFVQAAVLRYRNDPHVAGYHIWGLPGSLDWTTVDKPYWGQRLDYSSAALSEFQTWSQHKYASPPFASQDWSRPDLSAEWRDWVAFRAHGLDTFFIDSVLKPLRQLDDRRSVVAYFGLDYASPALARSAADLNWRRHTGGSELYYQTPLRSSMAVCDTGKTWPQEVHLLTPLPAGLELATFNISAPGGAAFHWNYYWRNDIPVGGWTAEREQALKEWQTLWRPLWEEMRDAAPATPPDLAAVMTWSTMHYGLRTFFPLRLGDYVTPTAAALYRDGLWPDWFTENAPLDNLSKYKLIVIPPTAAQVMPVRMAEALAAYVQAGGKLALFPDSGKWIVEEGGKPNGLLEKLGAGAWLTLPAKGGEFFDAGNSGLPENAGAEMRDAKPVRHSALLADSRALRLSSPLALPMAKAGGPATVEASFDDGAPAAVTWPFGRGQVALFAGVPDWPSNQGLWREIYHWAGGSRPVATDRPDVEANFLIKGDTRYVIVHRLTDSFRPQPPVLDRPQLRRQPPVVATWKLAGLPEGRWQVTEISADGPKKYSLSTGELSSGVQTSLFLAQTKVFKLEPASP